MSWDGKRYNKYTIAHTDGTPLKGKRYFVLRLDSEDTVEAARVRSAMRAYENLPRNCDVGTTEEQDERFFAFCNSHKCPSCPCRFIKKTDCALIWAQMPYESEGKR